MLLHSIIVVFDIVFVYSVGASVIQYVFSGFVFRSLDRFSSKFSLAQAIRAGYLIQQVACSTIDCSK